MSASQSCLPETRVASTKFFSANALVLFFLLLNLVLSKVRNHKMCWVWSKMPWFDWFFTESLEANDISFVTDQRISVIDCPIMILHAEDDAVVPFKLGRALYETALQTRGEDCRAIQFEAFSAELCYGHKYICRDPGLPDIFR